MGEYKILGRDKMLESHAFDIEKIHYELPNGRKRSYDLVDHSDAVTLVPISESGEVYFVRQYRVGAESMILELPAGVLDPGEPPIDTAKRELREEIGMAADDVVEIGKFYTSPGYSNEFMTIFLARGLYPAPLKADDDEFLAVEHYPLEQVFEMVRSGEIQDSKSLAGLLLALPYLKEGLSSLGY